MSSARNTPKKDNLFKTYIISQNEGEETEAEQEKPAEQTSSWSYEAYTPKRASFHTLRGKIKRYLA
jgi:hypothetical protein